MSTPSYQCPNCGETLEISVCPQGTTSTISCPRCQSEYIYCHDGKKVFIIDKRLYQAGEDNAYEYKEKFYLPLYCKQKLNKSKKCIASIPRQIKVASILFVCLAIIGSISAYVLSLPPSIKESQAFLHRDSIAKEFRKKMPYNYQTVGIKEYEDNSYLVYLSEPIPTINVDTLEAFFKEFNCDIKTYKTPIGVDGWVKDAAICFNDLDKEEFNTFRSNLFNLLYGTDYKASFMDFDAIPSHIPFSIYDLNMSVTAEELRSWFIDGHSTFLSTVDSTMLLRFSELFAEENSGVYYSSDPGFVVWSMNKYDNDIDKFRREARIFSLDSDLIFGAISDGQNVCIIAREREVPITELPPLRYETLLTLVSTNKDELSQSYERNHILAGK